MPASGDPTMTLQNGMLPTDCAFPRGSSLNEYGAFIDYGATGMDLRTWLAGQALAGFAAAGSSPATAGAGAVAYADAVIAALSGAPDAR